MDVLEDIELEVSRRILKTVIVAIVSIFFVLLQQVLLFLVLSKIEADTTMWVLYWICAPLLLLMSIVAAVNSGKKA